MSRLCVLILLFSLSLSFAIPMEYSFIREFGKKGTGDAQFSYPVNLTIDRYGNIYVTDWTISGL
ncbi:MAG: SBBP repeat-containing protein [Candidatus Wallbacteria bacterium]|nr:SBBP repeat-containing protein [Candidatus Wallbacteria bacterium]